MIDDDVLVASIDDLVSNFRSALLALLPAAERAMLTWADELQHRDWESLAESVFDAFVRGPLIADRGRVNGEFPLVRYDLDLDSYGQVSWLLCRTPSGEELAFVRLLSQGEPFDTIQGVVVDLDTMQAGARATIPWAGAKFAYLRRSPRGHPVRVAHVEADD